VNSRRPASHASEKRFIGPGFYGTPFPNHYRPLRCRGREIAVEARPPAHEELFLAVVILVAVIAAPDLSAQLSSSATWAAHADATYQTAPNLTYLTASNYESKLDIYYRRGATTPQPTMVYFHGGFWAAGNKEGAVTKILPWMEMGWNVVNVEYRLARVAVRLHDALTKAAVPNQLLTIPGGGHGNFTLEQRTTIYTIREFLAKHRLL
jgi:acetyl esterase/lipase